MLIRNKQNYKKSDKIDFSFLFISVKLKHLTINKYIGNKCGNRKRVDGNELIKLRLNKANWIEIEKHHGYFKYVYRKDNLLTLKLKTISY